MIRYKKHIALLLLILFTGQTIGAVTFLQQSQSVLVIEPFVNAGENTEIDYLRQALPQTISEKITNASQISVIGPEQAQSSNDVGTNQLSAAQNSGTQIPSSGTTRSVLGGQFVSIGSMIKIDITLRDADTESHLLEKSVYLLEGNELDEVTNQIVSSVASVLPGINNQQVSADNTSEPVANNSLEEQTNRPTVPVMNETKAVTSQWWYWALMGVGVAVGAYGIYKLVQSDANTSTVTIDFPLP